MAQPPIYVSRESAPSAQPGALTIRPVQAPDVSSGAIVGRAITEAAQAAAGFATRLRAAQQQTRTALATTDFLTRLDTEEESAARNPDYQSAPTVFGAAAAELERQTIDAARLDPQQAAELRLTLRRLTLASSGRVRAAALVRETDAHAAALGQSETSLLNNAAGAGSPTERAMYVGEYQRLLDQGVAAGWLAADKAQGLRSRFDGLLDEADMVRTIRERPAEAGALIADPKNFPAIDPVQRQKYLNAAEAAADGAATDRLRFMAAGERPERASMAWGTVLTPAHAEAIYKNGILGIEGGVRNGVGLTSPKGALGIGQLMPETARLVARQVGLADIAGLSDAALKQRLLTDHELNYRLGLKYWSDLVAQFGGNVAVAAAGYNAGPGRAAAWRDKAIAKFGEDFTPAEFASVIGIAETRDYVTNLYRRMGVAATGPGLSANGAWAGYAAVSTVLDQNAADERQGILSTAALARADNGFYETLKQGYAVDETALARYRSLQLQAAAAGSAEAVAELRRLDAAIAAKPSIDRAYMMPPAALDAAIATLDATARQRPLAEAERIQLDAYKAVQTESAGVRDTDPIKIAERAGMFRPVVIDPRASPTDGSFLAALAYRDGQAAAAQAAYGGALKPFHPAEATALGERLAAAGETETLAVLSSMARTMRPATFHAAIDQLDLDPIAETAAHFVLDRPELAREILRGAALLKTDTIAKPATELRSALAAALGGDLWPAPDMLGAVTDAALAVYVARRGGNGTLFATDDAGGIEDAIEAVTGPILTRNGVRVAAPPGRSAAEFDDILAHIGEDDIGAAGGAFDGLGQPLSAAALRAHGVLRQLEPGGSRYAIGMRAASSDFFPVRTKDGAPLVIDFATTPATAATARRPPPAAAAFLPPFGGIASGITLGPGVAPPQGLR